MNRVRGRALSDAAAGRTQSLGRKLSEIRRQRGWTLKQVANRSGMAVSTLSKVENHKISLTYDNLIKLAQGLEVDVSDLFSETPALLTSNRRSIARMSDAGLLATKNYDYYYLCRELKNKKMIPIVSVLKARSIEEFGDMVSHSGEEFIFVISGSIEVHTECYEPLALSEGEGIYIDSTMPHAYIGTSEEEAVVLGMCSSPETAEPAADAPVPPADAALPIALGRRVD